VVMALIDLPCQYCAVKAQEAAENGGRIFRNKFSNQPHGFIALVKDTEDNMIRLIYSMPLR